MSRHVRLILMFVVAAVLGLYLAYREQNNRNKALANAPTESGAAEVVQAGPAAEPGPAAAKAAADPRAAGSTRAAIPRAAAPARAQPKPDKWVAPKAEPDPKAPTEGPTRAY